MKLMIFIEGTERSWSRKGPSEVFCRRKFLLPAASCGCYSQIIARNDRQEINDMSKSHDAKKSTKKPALKTPAQKKQAKRDKKK